MKRAKLLCVAAVLTLAAGLVFFAPVAQAADAEPIKIGFYNCLTGSNAYGGQLELQGTELAKSLYPTVLDRPVELIVVDNKSDKIESANAVKRLTERDKVVAIIGTYASSLALAGGAVAEEAKVPVVGTSCTNPMVTEGKKYYFRVCFIDPYQGTAAATYVFKNLGFKKAGLLIDVTGDYPVALAKFFERDFTKLGGEVVAKLNYSAGDQDFTAQLTEIMTKEPDIVFIPGYFGDAAIIMKQARELGAKFRLMGADATDNPEVVTIAGKAAEGFLHTAFPYAKDMPNMSDLAKKFTDDWDKMYTGIEPNANSALGYNAYLLVIDAIKRAGSADSEAITQALAETKGLMTPLGELSINETHDPEMPVGIIEIRDGKRTYLGEIKPD